MQIQIFLIRGIVAIAWAVAFATVADELTTGTSVLLVLYPMIDMVATAADARGQHGSTRQLLLVNAGISAVVAVALGIASTGDIGDVLTVFGAWAVVTGALQVGVAVRRRRRFGKQWPMLLAGSFSVLAGSAFIMQGASDDPTFDRTIVYAAAGGIFFVIQSGLLARRLHRTAIAV
jgi:uncharacterized membrane protein HdeD (DUF308 family)